MSQISEPIIKPYRTKDGAYLLHPEFISGLIAQIAWQCTNPISGEADLEAGRALLEGALVLFSLQVQSDVIERGGSAQDADYQVQEMFSCFDATALGIQ